MFHKNVRGENLHGSKAKLVAGTPVGVITPLSIGEFYFDTDNDELYISIGTTNTSWKKVTLTSV